MLRILERLLGMTRLTLTERERALLFRKGRIVDVLGAGEHRIRRRDMRERVVLDNPVLPSDLAEVLHRDAPELAGVHVMDVTTGTGELAVLIRDGRPFRVMEPERRVTLWNALGPYEVIRVTEDDPRTVDTKLGDRLERVGLNAWITRVEVGEGHVGVMTRNGTNATALAPGLHRFWRVGPAIAVKIVDTRLRAHEVTGHEILTRDRVTLRVNLTAEYRVVDPIRAVTTVRDFEEALHRALGLAFRRTLGALTLDALLADKVAVDADAAEAVRAEMAALGVAVGTIALKDVILPGEMRDILTRVVAAEKEAEANVIRRREETNATRSLLNTAKVMAENPVMLRLKELEALEVIAGKVERLTVHNGTAGLLGDVAKLRD